MHRYLIISLLSIFLVIMSAGCKKQEQREQADAGSSENSDLEVVLTVPGMENVIIKEDIEYLSENNVTLTLDIYYPPGFTFDSNLPVVLTIFGYGNDAAVKLVGSPLKDWSCYISWGKLIAASGMAALLYETNSPEKDLNILLQFIHDRSDQFHIDKDRIGIYSCSANVPTALVNCMDETKKYYRCAVFYYGFFLTTGQDYISEIESLSQEMGFSTPKLDVNVKLRNDLPLLIVRAGLDNIPHLNETIDDFVSKAVNQNLPMVFINYPEGHHGFDAYDDNAQSREIIKRTLEFWKIHLLDK